MSREIVRRALDEYFERATGRPGGGLADYIQRLRGSHGVALNRQGQYRGCVCGDVMCGKDTLLAWCDELVASYEAKVQEFAAETRRNSASVASAGSAQQPATDLEENQ